MNAKELNTREKILTVANQLFGRKGYDSVSIRDISKEAAVNISAINYHFQNKLNLYKEVIEDSINHIVKDLELIASKDTINNSMEYIGATFDYFKDNENQLLSTFKFFMSMSEIFQEIEVDCMEGDLPPGGEILWQLLKKEAPTAQDEDLAWAVRSICALCFHKAIVACNKSVIEQKKKYGITQELFKQDLLKCSSLIVEALKKN